MSNLKVPVVLIVFNRPRATQLLFSQVAAARPDRLFLIADGPRADRLGEAEKCANVRSIINAVDWECDVQTNFATENMGCGPRVVSGLNWVFSQVEEAIILEDDCIPAPAFFPYCVELLDRYRDQPNIACILGFNPLERELEIPYSYLFSLVIGFWGWATWRRAWQQFEGGFSEWPRMKADKSLYELFCNRKHADYWVKVFDTMYEGRGPKVWGYQWVYTCWTRHLLSISPAKNLIHNIGMDENATHTVDFDPRLALRASELALPLQHPPAIVPSYSYLAAYQKLYELPIGRRISRKMKKIFAR